MLDGFPRPRHCCQVVAVSRLWCWDCGAETLAGAGPGKRKVVRAIVEDGGVVTAVSEEGNQDAPRSGQEDVVDVMIPVNHQSSSNVACSEKG